MPLWKFKVSIPLISMPKTGTCGQMKTSLLHTEGPANQKVWHLSQYSLLKGKSQRCSGDIKVSSFTASAFACVTRYQQEMCVMLVSQSYSGTARQTDQSSFLSSPDQMKWVLLKDKAALHIFYLILTVSFAWYPVNVDSLIISTTLALRRFCQLLII